jgi:hypothetical protein
MDEPARGAVPALFIDHAAGLEWAIAERMLHLQQCEEKKEAR